VIGSRLVPMLISAGHQVTGMTRSPDKLAALGETGAEPVLADALDAAAVSRAVAAARPDAVVHQLTAIPARIDPRRIEQDFELNDRLRSQGTRILVDAAREANAGLIIAQSIAFAYAPGAPGTVHVESDPLAGGRIRAFARSAAALADLENAVLGADGTVLRYGYLYGEGTAISREGSMGQDLARRRMPIVGAGRGVWSFVHAHDAAGATVRALEGEHRGVYNIVDDEPAAVERWLPALALAIGAPRPRRVPTFLARLLVGEYGVATMTQAQGASNALARETFGWHPEHPTWREGFTGALDS
jgi:nucleoside-diphosphate-sugar epimerase